MLKLEYSCGQRGYFSYMHDEDNILTLSLDIDTMNVDYSDENGLSIVCPRCKTTYDIILVT